MQKSRLQINKNSKNKTAALKNKYYTFFYSKPRHIDMHKKHTFVMRSNEGDEIVLHGNVVRGLKSVLNTKNKQVVRKYSDNVVVDYDDCSSQKKASNMVIETDEASLYFDGRDLFSMRKVLEAV
jgi:hypothetical protein